MKHFTYPELDDFKREYLDRVFETTAIVKPDASRNGVFFLLLCARHDG